MASLSELRKTLQDEIEVNYTMQKTSAIVNQLWWVPLLACALYLALVWYGKKWMEKRAPFGLRGPLFVWNLCLAIFSITGAVVELPLLLSNIRDKGFDSSVCNSAIHYTPLLSFFALLFAFSKIVEFGDTFFVVMRKTPLNFLHWYHHVTVCVFSWHSLAIQSAPAHWYCAMNYAVHSVMYSYYIIKSSGLRMHSSVSKGVTILQLMQFVVGFIIVVRSIWLFTSGVPCLTNGLNCFLGISIYLSYIVLFSNFFYQRYMNVEKKKKQ